MDLVLMHRAIFNGHFKMLIFLFNIMMPWY